MEHEQDKDQNISKWTMDMDVRGRCRSNKICDTHLQKLNGSRLRRILKFAVAVKIRHDHQETWEHDMGFHTF